MSDVSVGQGDATDSNENAAEKGRNNNSKTFGEEGTNKTQPLPDPDAKPSDVGLGKFTESTPYTR